MQGVVVACKCAGNNTVESHGMPSHYERSLAIIRDASQKEMASAMSNMPLN